MTLETIKSSIDRKIDKLLKDENLTFTEVINKLESTINNFQKLYEADSNSDARKLMLAQYIAFSRKRIGDMEFANLNLENNSFFAGASEIDLMKLIRLRDKVSLDALELELN